MNNVDPLGLYGEGFLYNWLAERIEGSISGTASPTWAFTGSLLGQFLQTGAGLDPAFSSYQQTTHQIDVYGALGAREGTKLLAKEAGGQLLEFTPIPDVKRALDPNADTLSKVGYWAGAGGKTILLVLPIKAAVAGGARPPPLPAGPLRVIAKPSPGVTVTKVGDCFVKQVNPRAPKVLQWYGKRSLRYQHEGLVRLGEKGAPHTYDGSTLTTLDVGTYQPGSFWRTWWEGTKRLGTPMNDIRPRNIGANGIIFDPAIDPIQRGIYWTGVGVGSAYIANELWGDEILDALLSEDEESVK